MKRDPLKIEYEPPKLIQYGDLAELTKDEFHGHPGDPIHDGVPHPEHLTLSNA